MQTKIVKLSSCDVVIKTGITWGDKETLQSVLMSGAKFNQAVAEVNPKATAKEPSIDFDASVLQEAKYKALELVIVEIIEGDKKKQFSRDWMNNLEVDDGDKLFAEVDDVAQITKKK